MKYSLAQIKKALIETWTVEGDLNFHMDKNGKWLIDDWEIFFDNLLLAVKETKDGAH